MKRLFKLFLIMIMAIPFVARADMGAPQLREFEAVVVQEGGIDTYKYNQGYKLDGKLEKGTVVTVKYGPIGDGYYSVETKDGREYTVKGNGLMATEEEVGIGSKGVSKLTNPIEILIYKDGGVDVRKGPNDIYDVVGRVDKGTKITVYYAIDGNDSTFDYIDYNGVKGWVDSSNMAVLYKRPTYYIFSQDTKLGSTLIPKNEVLLSEYASNMWDRSALFTYKNETGLLEVFRDEVILHVADRVQGYKTTKTVKTYANSTYAKNKPSIGTLDAGTEVYLMGNTEEITSSGYAGAYVLIKGKNEYTWIEFSDDLVETDTILLTDLINVKPIEPTTEPSTPEPKEEKKSFSTKDVVIISAIVGGCVALTAVVVIVLINKKKNKK